MSERPKLIYIGNAHWEIGKEIVARIQSFESEREVQRLQENGYRIVSAQVLTQRGISNGGEILVFAVPREWMGT